MTRATDHLPFFHRAAPVKEPVRVATTGNVTIATALNDGDTIDGITLATGDRVLVWQQSTASQNGIYVVGAAPARAYDMDTADEFPGCMVSVLDGTTYQSSLFQNTNTGEVDLETTGITFAPVIADAPNAELNIEGGQSVVNPRGTLGATETVDPTDGNVITGTLDQDCTITLSAPLGSGGASLEWWLTQSGGSWTPTFSPTGGTFAWDGDAPTFPADGETFRVITERIPGTTNDWVGNLVGGGAASSNLHDEPMIASDGSVMTDGLLNPLMHEVAW